MNVQRLILQSLRYYWPSQLSVALGAAAAAAVLIGALVVGDSVSHSLHRMALARIGKVHLALTSHDRFFTDALAEPVGKTLGAPAAAVVHRLGIATTGDGRARANGVNLLGVDEAYWELAPGAADLPQLADGDAFINERLAQQLNVQTGDRIVIRVEQPGTLPRDMPLASDEDVAVALPMRIAAVVGDEAFGRFSLHANQVPPFNAFVPRRWMQSQIGVPGRANVMLIGPAGETSPTVTAADDALQSHWRGGDAELELLAVREGAEMELRSRRVFLDAPVQEAACHVPHEAAVGVLTYFVNRLKRGEVATPYSMVAAIGPLDADSPMPEAYRALVPPDMADDEIVINEWLADDLGAAPGDTIDLSYFIIGPQRKLIEVTNTFRVRAIVPIEGLAADRDLMPAYPGIADADHCRDWKPGTPIDLDRIRDKDEAYWDDYRGTPKAFVTLAAGQRMWANRFGNLTAVRYMTSADATTIETALLANLEPRQVGLSFADVREPALAASSQALDFGTLFLSLSFFLIVAALLLTTLLFAFGVEQRTESIGLMLALGFKPQQVRRLLLAEGLALAVIGAAVGAGAGLLYTRAVLTALASVWRGAVGTGDIAFHANGRTIAIGIMVSILVALLAIAWTLRRQGRQPIRQLLAIGAGSGATALTARRCRAAIITAAVCVVAAVAIALFAPTDSAEATAGAFFGSGSLLLIAGLALCRNLLGRGAERSNPAGMTITSIGMRSAARRSGRSLATITLLACGVFLLIAVGAFYRSPVEDPTIRSSGTGGFTLLGETQLPLLQDLADPRSREELGLEADDLAGVDYVPLRVREGDDASCLNLNRAQQPRLIGVQPQLLTQRGAFTITRTLPNLPADWSILDSDMGENILPALADQSTVQWALQTKPGATISYIDERGRTFEVRIVGVLADSILQGNLIVAEDRLLERFPSVTGYRMLLIDAPLDRAADVAASLTRALEDVGLQVSTTRDRLAAFNAVNNTYLAIFQALGALGLILGSVGLGIVVMRNVLERRQELAMLRAIGFRRATLRRMVFSEHVLLLALGLAVGLVAAGVAVAPAVQTIRTALLATGTALLIVLASGIIWVYAASTLAVRGSLRAALQAE